MTYMNTVTGCNTRADFYSKAWFPNGNKTIIQKYHKNSTAWALHDGLEPEGPEAPAPVPVGGGERLERALQQPRVRHHVAAPLAAGTKGNRRGLDLSLPDDW